MDLQTPRRERILKFQYTGRAVRATDILYKPIKILFFEIAKSQIHEGQELLVMQTECIDKETGEIIHQPVMTESFTLIDTIKETEDSLPHYTKIIRKRDGYLYFVVLNNEEKKKLLTI